MPRFRILGALALVTAMAALSARAAAPTLPPESIADDTLAVIHVDAAHFNSDALQNAATALLGANANKVDDQLKMFKEKYDKATAAGAVAITVVVAAPKKPAAGAVAPAADAPPGRDDGNGIMYVQLKPGADVKVIEGLMTEDMAPDVKAKTVFEEAGNFLAIHRKDQVFPVKPNVARSAIFSDALGTISDAAIAVAFVSDDATRDELLKRAATGPKPLQDIAPLLAKCNWMTLAISFGNTPSIAGTANAASVENAKALADSLNNSLADLKAQAANPGPNAGRMAFIGPIIAPMIDSLKPTTAGTQVTSTINTETLKTIANFAAQFGALSGRRGGPGPQ